MSLFHYLHGLGEDMCGRSGRRSRARSERRLQRMCSCFPQPREAHRRLGVSRRRVLPDIAWCNPARESFPKLFGERGGIKCHILGTVGSKWMQTESAEALLRDEGTN